MEPKSVFLISSEQTIGVTSAIAWLAARAGFEVRLKCEGEATPGQIEKKLQEATGIETSITKMGEAETEDALNRIKSTDNLSDAGQASIVVESLFEDMDLKREVLTELDAVCHSDTIFLTNTSTIMITRLTSGTSRADRVIGMHFIYYSPVMKVVEIARSLKTSDNTFSMARAFAADLGLDTVMSEDVPGLLSSRIWMVHINEAANNVFNKQVQADALMKLNRTISPNTLSVLESADFIGLDNCAARLANLYLAYGDPKYIPSPLLTRMVDEGKLGVKSGEGFFHY